MNNNNNTNQLHYTRQLVLTVLQSSYFTLYEISQSKKETSNQELKNSIVNFKQFFNCLLDMVLPPNQMMKTQQIKGANDPESTHVAFANNAIFWLSYSCLECASVHVEDELGIAAEL